MTLTTGWIPQAGVIPIRRGRICLVTSSSGKRWVVPKGCIEPGKTAGEIALQEAWEEAGLVGVLWPEPTGSYRYEKYGRICHVILFAMQVTEAADEWPEQELRQRSWLTPAQALSRLEDPGLGEIVRAVLAREELQS